MLSYISNTDGELKPNVRGDLEKKLTDLYVFMENHNIFFSKMTFEHNGKEIIATVDKEDFTYKIKEQGGDKEKCETDISTG